MPGRTIATRLTLSYALPLLAVLVVGWMALERLGRVRNALEAAAQENSAAMQLATAGLVHASETSRLIHEALLEPDPLRARAILDAVQTNRDRAHRIDASMHAVLRTQEARAAFSSVEAACDEFGRAFAPFKARLLSGRRQEATRLVREELLPARRRVQEAWQGFVAWHHREIQSAAYRASEQYAQARREVVLAVLLAATICLAAGIIVTASVVRPVSEVVRIARQVARGDLRDRVVVTRADELGHLQEAMAKMCDRLESVLSQVHRGAHELATASQGIRENARWLLEHTSVQASAASEMVGTLHQMGAASARSIDAARRLRPLLAADLVDSLALAEAPPGAAGGAILQLPRAVPARESEALLEIVEESANELWDGVARVNRTVLSVDRIARDNALKAQELWCTAEALSRRAGTLQRTVDFFEVRAPGADASIAPPSA